MKFVILLLQSARLPDPLPGYEHGINPDSSRRDLRREVRFKLTKFHHGRRKLDDPQLHARRDCWPSGWRARRFVCFSDSWLVHSDIGREVESAISRDAVALGLR